MCAFCLHPIQSSNGTAKISPTQQLECQQSMAVSCLQETVNMATHVMATTIAAEPPDAQEVFKNVCYQQKELSPISQLTSTMHTAT